MRSHLLVRRSGPKWPKSEADDGFMGRMLSHWRIRWSRTLRRRPSSMTLKESLSKDRCVEDGRSIKKSPSANQNLAKLCEEKGVIEASLATVQGLSARSAAQEYQIEDSRIIAVAVGRPPRPWDSPMT